MGIIGLGKMGTGLALQALGKGLMVKGYTVGPIDDRLSKMGIVVATSLEDLIASMRAPRKIFLYVPAGHAVEGIVTNLAPLLERGDILVDGGNSYWGDSRRRSRVLAEKGIRFLDAGTSGGISGAFHGATFMVGGDRSAYEEIRPLLEQISAPQAYAYIGPSGTGHLVKLIHNGIEFGMLQAIGEGMALLEKYREQLPIDMEAVFQTYRNGSVIRSWLIDLMAQEYEAKGGPMEIPSWVEDTGEVNWLLEDALHLEVPIPVIGQSIMELFRSRDKTAIDHRAVALMRHGFGGHVFGPDEHIRHERTSSRIDSNFPELRHE